MLTELPPPTGHCTACGRGHYAAVRFCPFCGAEQARAPRPIPEAPKPPRPHPPPRPPAASISPEPSSRAPSPVPQVAPRPQQPPPLLPAPVPSRPRPARRRRVGPRQAILALLAITALAILAHARRDPPPAPARIAVGPTWTAVSLPAFRAAPLLALGADAPFSLRLDGERVMRVAPGSSTLIRPGALRGLELRSGRGQVSVTLTPRRE